MKKGYKRLLILLITLISILLIDTFTLNFLSGYKMVFALLILIVLFDIVFVLEKDKHRYLKDIFIEIVLFILLYFVVFYLLGLLVGLAKTPNYLALKSFTNNILPLFFYIIAREFLRYNMLCKADGNMISTIVVVLFFIILDMTNDLYYASFSTNYEILKFVSLSFLPVIAKNISYSYVTKKMGYKPVMLFDVIFSMYPYFLPIIPNPNEYLMSIIYLLVPILFAYRVLKFFDAKADDVLPRNYHKRKFKGILVPLCIILVMVYFYSGYFRFYSVAIASGSMAPEINVGDIVIADQKANFNKLKKGDVIAYKRDDIIVVHRIEKKTKYEGSYLYYTKGDTNSNIDDFVIEADNFIGKVKFKLPYIGYPTVWLNKE